MTTKHPNNIWQKAENLVERLLTTTSGLDLTYADRWSVLLIVSLHQSNKRLHSIVLLLKNQDWDSAVVLTRSIFELSANLAYISKDIEKRLSKYLKHGMILITAEEIQQHQKEIDSGIISKTLDRVPKQPWKPMSAICEDLGVDWQKEYNSFYRYASIPTHSGAFTLGKSFMQLLNGNPLTDKELSSVLITAASFHIRIAKIAGENFPKQISLEEIGKFDTECNKIGKALA